MNLKIITKHMGNPEKLEFTYHTSYDQVGVFTYVRRYGVTPVQPYFCIVDGGFRYCEDCDQFTNDGCVDQTEVTHNMVMAIIDSLITKGYPYTEDHGEMIIDSTGHKPSYCDEHEFSGCIHCYGCLEEHKE